MYGTLDNLKGRDFDAQINNTAGIKGTLDIKGLPNIDETFLDLAFEPLYVNTYELESIIGKGKLPESVLKLGTINYNGRVTGFAYNLVTFGDIVTDEGNMYTDVNFQYDPEELPRLLPKHYILLVLSAIISLGIGLSPAWLQSLIS